MGRRARRFGLVEEGCELGQLGSQLIGDLAPLCSTGLGVMLREGGGDEDMRMKWTRQATAALMGHVDPSAHKLSQRYERAPMVITTNRAYKHW
jgi:hypothetical protein